MSSLQISPDEQVDFIRRLLGRKLSVSDAAYDKAAASIPRFSGAGGWTVHGKTGTGYIGGDEGHQVGWFVGWADKGDRRVAFAHLENEIENSKTPGGFVARATVLADLPRFVGG